MNYTVRIKKNDTGEIRTSREFPEWNDSSEFLWTEGNYSCDCNRRLFFYPDDDSVDVDSSECSDGLFTVIDATLEDGTVIQLEKESVMDKFQFHSYLTARGFVGDDCGIAFLFYRGGQVVSTTAFAGQKSQLNAGVNGEKKLAFEGAPLPETQLDADRILNRLAEIEKSQAVGKAVEIIRTSAPKPKGSWVLSTPTGPVPVEFNDWGPKNRRDGISFLSTWPQCQSFAERRPGDNLNRLRILDHLFRTPEIREDVDQQRRTDMAGKVYRTLKSDVEKLEEKLKTRDFTTTRIDDRAHPYVCSVSASYHHRDASADGLKWTDLRDGEPFTLRVLANPGGADRLRHHRNLIVDLTTMWARLKALRLLDKTLRERGTKEAWYETIEPGIYKIKLKRTGSEHNVLIGKSVGGRRWIASTLWNSPALLADVADLIGTIAKPARIQI